MKVVGKKESGASAIKSFIQFSYGTWVLAFVNLLATPITTWLISPENFGKASMFTLIYNFLINIVLVGADQSFSRMYFEQPIRKKTALLTASLALPLVMTCVSALFIISFWDALSLLLFGQIESIGIAWIINCSILSGVFFRFGTLLLRMQKAAHAYSVLSILNGVLNVLLIIGFSFYVGRDFKAIIYSFFLSNVATAILAVLLNLKFWKIAVKQGDIKLLKPIVQYGLPFVPVFLIDWLFQATDRFFLRHYASFDDIGLYAASFKIVAALNMLQAGFNLFWVPFSYEKFSDNPNDTRIYSQTFNLISAGLFFIITVIIIFKGYIAAILANSYQEIETIIPFLLFIPVLFTLSEVTVVGINFLKKTKYHLYISIIAFSCNALLNFALVPIWGVKGAAISTSVSYIAFFTCRTIFANKFYNIKYSWHKFIAALLVAFTSAAIASFSTNDLLNVTIGIIGVILCLLIYLKEWKELYYLVESKIYTDRF